MKASDTVEKAIRRVTTREIMTVLRDTNGWINAPKLWSTLMGASEIGNSDLGAIRNIDFLVRYLVTQGDVSCELIANLEGCSSMNIIINGELMDLRETKKISRYYKSGAHIESLSYAYMLTAQGLEKVKFKPLWPTFVVATVLIATGCAQRTLPVKPMTASDQTFVQVRTADGDSTWVQCASNCPEPTPKIIPQTPLDIAKIPMKEESKIEISNFSMFFKINSALISKADEAGLKKIALSGKLDGVKIIGRADTSGRLEWNMKLAKWRADEAQKILIAAGVPAEKIIVETAVNNSVVPEKFVTLSAKPKGHGGVSRRVDISFAQKVSK